MWCAPITPYLDDVRNANENTDFTDLTEPNIPKLSEHQIPGPNKPDM